MKKISAEELQNEFKSFITLINLKKKNCSSELIEKNQTHITELIDLYRDFQYLTYDREVKNKKDMVLCFLPNKKDEIHRLRIDFHCLKLLLEGDFLRK